MNERMAMLDVEVGGTGNTRTVDQPSGTPAIRIPSMTRSRQAR